jgi:hypothetical protein
MVYVVFAAIDGHFYQRLVGGPFLTQPTRYDRTFSFTDFSGGNPLAQQPGPRIDAELDALTLTTDQICDNLALIQRDDGHLRNGIVTRDALAVDTDFKGDPGGNVMAIGLFTAASFLSIPLGADLVQTSGHGVTGIGFARYISDAAVNSAYVAAHPLSSFISANGRGFRLAEAPLSPDFYGARGDGSTNDTAAFVALAADVNAAGGGNILIPARTYMVGSQTFAGGTGHGYSYQGQGVLQFINCTKPVNIYMHGAKLKYVSGLKFGSFDPTTGASYSPTMPFLNQDYAARIGFCISATTCSGGLFVYGGELDGNSAGAVLGGTFGDTGWQLIHTGLTWVSSPGGALGTNIHHFCLDGLSVEDPGLTETQLGKAVRLEGVTSEYNSRQGLSWVGGRGLIAIDCKFKHTGRGAFASSPKAGVDIEAEASVCRAGLFIRCEFADNLGVGLVADSGDSADVHCIDCDFFATSGGSYAVWPAKPRYRFTNCRFSGMALGNYTASNRADATVFDGCHFGHTQFDGLTVFGASLFDAAGNPIYRGCTFVTTNAAVSVGSASVATEFHDCDFLQNGSTANCAIISTFYGHNKFTITTGSVDFAGYTNYGKITGTGTWLSAAVAGGEIGSITPAVQVGYVLGTNAFSYQINSVRVTHDIPSTVFPVATFVVGDFSRNNSPTLGSAGFWVCTAAPNTWQPVGIVGAIRAAHVADPAAITAGTATNAVAAPTQAEFNALVTVVAALKTDLTATRTALVNANASLQTAKLMA